MKLYLVYSLRVLNFEGTVATIKHISHQILITIMWHPDTLIIPTEKYKILYRYLFKKKKLHYSNENKFFN